MSVGLINRSEKTRYILFDKRLLSSVGVHYRSDYELIFNVRGQRTIKIGDSSHTLHSGDIVAVGPYISRQIIHAVEDTHPDDCFSVVFRTTSLGREFVNSKHFKQIRTFLSQTGYGLIYSGPLNRSIFESASLLNNTFHFNEVIHLLSILNQLASGTHFKTIAGNRCHIPTIKRNQQLVLTICSYVDNHYQESLYIEDVAQHFCMARSTFTRFFKSNVGMPFIKYLNKARVRHACNMLESGREPVVNIATAVGYSSLSNFNNQFRLLMSMSPSSYRKRQAVSA